MSVGSLIKRVQNIAQHVGHYEDFLTSTKKKKLRWCGNVTVQPGAKKELSKTSAEKKKRGQRKRWSDSTEELTEKTFAETRAISHNRRYWSRFVQPSMQPPSRPVMTMRRPK